MKRLLFVTLLLLISFIVQKSFAQEDEDYLAKVKATEYDEDYNVINAVLLVEFEEEDDEGNINTFEEQYKIEVDKIGKKLLELDGATIKFTGTFIENDDGSVAVKVKSFNIINAAEQSEEDEPEDN